MNPPMPPSMKLQLTRTRRNVTQHSLDRARADGASPTRIDQLERDLARLDKQIAGFAEAEAETEDESAALPYRKDTDG